jgi:hypothetical protein
MIATIATIIRVEQIQEIANAPFCRQLKAKFDKPIDCLLTFAIMHNRMRKRPDTDALASDTGDSIAKGCAMMVWDISEEQFASLTKTLR